MDIQLLRVDEARSSARKSLRLGSGCADADSRFEVLRAAVWSLSWDRGPVYVAKILNVAMPSWRLLCARTTGDDAMLRAELRAALQSLQDAGDLVEAAGGLWTSAATRVISLDHGAGQLLVGGAPLALLPIDANLVLHHGPYRRLQSAGGLGALIPDEEQASWAHLPEAPLREWARQLAESLERVPYTPSTNEGFEFYLPEKAQRRAPQFKRWQDQPGDAKGTLLAKRRRLYGAREYRLVDVSGGRIVRACELPTSEARRLMYAFDAEAANPVRARCTDSASDDVEVILTSELPHAEQRLLAALGTLKIPLDKPWERRWTFPRKQELPIRLLRSLCIEIDSALPRKAK